MFVKNYKKKKNVMNFKTKSVYAELHTEMQPKESDTLIKNYLPRKAI